MMAKVPLSPCVDLHHAVAENFASMARCQDPETWRCGAVSNIYEYMEEKLKQKLNRARGSGSQEAAWAFRMSPNKIRHGMVFCQGSSEQTGLSPFTGQVYGEQWWPCIFTTVHIHDEYFPYYCPALAWQGSRPWMIHRSRVVHVHVQPPPPPPPPPPPGPPPRSPRSPWSASWSDISEGFEGESTTSGSSSAVEVSAVEVFEVDSNDSACKLNQEWVNVAAVTTENRPRSSEPRRRRWNRRKEEPDE